MIEWLYFSGGIVVGIAISYLALRFAKRKMIKKLGLSQEQVKQMQELAKNMYKATE